MIASITLSSSMPRSPEGPTRAPAPPSADRNSPDTLDAATLANIRKAVALRERLAKKQQLLWHDKSGAERSPSEQEIRHYISDAENEWYEMVKDLLGVDRELLWKITKRMLEGES